MAAWVLAAGLPAPGLAAGCLALAAGWLLAAERPLPLPGQMASVFEHLTSMSWSLQYMAPNGLIFEVFSSLYGGHLFNQTPAYVYVSLSLYVCMCIYRLDSLTGYLLL